MDLNKEHFLFAGNVTNSLLLLSNIQFIESRVYEDEDVTETGLDTGYTLSEALILASINPKYDIKICTLCYKNCPKYGVQMGFNFVAFFSFHF